MTGQFTFDDPFARLNQRITDLETLVRQVAGGPKVGLADIRSDTVGAPFPLTTAGLGASNWEDDAAGGGTPQVTMTTGSRAIIMWACRASYVGDLGTSIGQTDFRSNSVAMGVQIDATEPQLWPAPAMLMAWANTLFNVFEFQPLAYYVVREDLEPGEHTFTMRYFGFDTTPTGTVLPQFDDQNLIVIPLGWQ